MIETTEDAFIGGRLMLRQPKEGLRAGIDAVLLAAAVAARAGERVLEAGSGSGIVSLLIARRIEGVRVDGIEIDPSLVALSVGNARASGLAERAAFHAGDVTEGVRALEGAGLARESFDHVVANPPFIIDGEGRPPRREQARRATSMPAADLDGWLRLLATACRPGGCLWLVHRADALPRLFEATEGRFGGLCVLPLFPRMGEAASRVILSGTKGSRAPMRLLQGLVLHAGTGGTFTPEASAVLRDGAALPIG